MRRDKRYHNKKWLKKKYIDQDKSSYEIAEICDVSQTTISAWLGKHNIKTKNIGRPSQRIEKACKSCGKTFQVKPSRKNEEYCSQQCAVEDRKARKDKRSPRFHTRRDGSEVRCFPYYI